MRLLWPIVLVCLVCAPPAIAQIALERSPMLSFPESPPRERLITYCQMSAADSMWMLVAESCEHRLGVFGLVDTLNVDNFGNTTFHGWQPILRWDRKRYLLGYLRFHRTRLGGNVRLSESLDAGESWRAVNSPTSAGRACDLQMAFDPMRVGVAVLLWTDGRAGAWDLYFSEVDSTSMVSYEAN